MAQLVGGVLGAVAGSFVGIPQLGWLVGSAIGGYAGKAFGSTNPGPKPQDMPNVNQALRGSPVFVTFGTNRVYPQITWTKNWTATRLSGGKKGGKGGGSGGAGAAKGSSNATPYEYTWDLIYNFGIFDVPSYPRTGWIGGDAIDLSTMTAILSGHNSAQAQLAAIFSANYSGANPILTKNTPKATLSFAEVHYAPGFPTGSADLETWSYLQQQEGVAVAWPYNAWLGLKTLDLGVTPIVPQLSFEFGPLGTSPTLVAGTFINWNNSADLGAGSLNPSGPFSNTNHIVGEDGLRYIIQYTNIGPFLYCADTDTFTELDSAYVSARFTDLSQTAGASMGGILGSPEKPFFFILTYDIVGININYRICRVKINSDGSQTSDGYITGSTTTDLEFIIYAWGAGCNSADAYFAVTGGIGTNAFRPYLLRLPLAGDSIIAGANTWASNYLTLLGFGDRCWSPFILTSRVSYQRACVVFNTSGTPGVLFYVDQNMVDTVEVYGGNDLIDNATQPMVVYSDDDTGYTDMSASFGVPFSDTLLKYDGTASANYHDDYSSPNGLNGGQFIAFARIYTDKAEYSNVRLFQWNDGAPISAGTTQLRFWDAVINGGINPLVRDTYYPRDVQLGYNPGNNRITLQASWNGALGDALVYSDIGSLATDVTPAYIIYRILTDTAWGFGRTNVDVTSYANAHTYCLSQGIIVSVTYTQPDALLSIIDQLLSLYNGYLTDDGGQIKFGWQTGSDVADGVVIDNSRLVANPNEAPVQVTQAAVQDGYNKIKFNYLDRKLDYKQNQIEIADEVDIDLNGLRFKEWPANYVMAGSLAQAIAERALWTNLYGRDQYKFQLGPKDAHRQPGDLITLVDSFHPDLRNGVVARITRWKESRRLVFDVEAVQYRGYHLDNPRSYFDVSSNDSGQSYIQDVALVVNQVAYELPQEYQGAQPVVYFGYNQFSPVMGAQLYLSADGATYTAVDNQQPYIISGKMAVPLENRPNGYVERDVTFYLMPGSNFTTSTPTFCQTHALDAVSQGTRAIGGGCLYVGSEMVAMEDLTLLGQNFYRTSRLYRGWGGTPISAHNSGDFFHQHGGGVLKFPITTDKIGQTIYYKIAPYNFAGHGVNVASITANTYQITGMYWKPRIQPKSKLWVDSAGSWPNSTAFTGDNLKTVAGGCALTLTWPAASNVEGYGQGGFGASTYGHFALETNTPSYRINVSSVNGTAVSSFVVNTGYFRYTLDQNSADFNGAAGNMQFRITPFNSYGDGPGYDTRTLNLFW